ncbi:hypothetical protein AM593_10606, partial [Mytilus galloprovincialis]
LDSADDHRRSVANSYGQLCDNTLESGWYRIISKAGERMPTECIVGGFRCGTMSPIWMSGTYPIINETNSVTACTADYNGNCCAYSHQIKVKNCTDYLVYSLVPVAQCYQAYCFGSELPCPTGETSENGFSPGCRRKLTTTTFTKKQSTSTITATPPQTPPLTTTTRSTPQTTEIPNEESTTEETTDTSSAAIASSLTTSHSEDISTTSLATSTHLPNKDEKAESSISMTVVGLTVLVVFLLIVIAVFVVVFRRKHNCVNNTKRSFPPTYEETVKTEKITNPYAQIEEISHYSCINENNYNGGYDEIPYDKNQTVQDNKLYLQNFATMPASNQMVEENEIYLQNPLTLPLDHPE